MIKLIVTDLDGSLLNDKKELPVGFWEFEQQLIQQNIVLGIASGRPHHNLLALFEPIKDRTYFLSDNGSYVTYQGNELLVEMLDPEGVSAFVQKARTLNKVYPVLCGKDKAYMEDREEALLKQALQYYQHYELVDDLTKVTEPILKVSLCDLVDAETNSYPHFKQYEAAYKVAVAGKRWLDFTAFSANKGVAVQLVQQALGIGYNETMVFGDYLNDLEMMRVAKYSYAMKNAHPGIIDAANFITDFDNNEAGVVRAICNNLVLEPQ
ncbi:HAD family hydrolase [Niabella sp. CC-SYL272]|uniref:HAD family hydrolase n=1 Tax=Niabella agricola TaxID=2891571 RepID=UPI001F1DDF7C|nr:HAD family hydrolase [Niabella agricola]MCF3110118.1 HAD family hydrolase [Niabella agricola]